MINLMINVRFPDTVNRFLGTRKKPRFWYLITLYLLIYLSSVKFKAW